MTMSHVYQQPPAAVNQTFHDVTSQKDARGSKVSPTFDSRNISAKDIGKFLGPKKYAEVLELTIKMGNKAKEVRKGDWAIKNLETEFKKHGLPLNRTGHKDLKHDKDKAVINLMLGVMAETNNETSSDPSNPPLGDRLGDRFCAWIRDPTSVYAGGQQVLLAEMNKAAKQAPEQHVSSETVGADAVHKDAGMCERDIRPETVHQSYYDEKQPSSEPASGATAPPPPYEDSQNVQAIQVERANIQLIASHLGQWQGTQEKQGDIEYYGRELVRINEFIQHQQFRGAGVELHCEFNHLQTECARAQSQLELYKFGKCKKELRELRSSLCGIDVEAKNSSQIDELEGKLHALSKQAGSNNLEQAGSNNLENERQDLQASIEVVIKEDIGAWRSGVAVSGTLESLRLELAELKSLNSLESVESYSKRIDELKKSTRSLPASKHRTYLVIQASKLGKEFMGIQGQVITQQIKDRFEEAQSKINLLPGCWDEREKLRLLAKADTSLQSARSMLEQQKAGASEGNLEQLRLLSEQVGEHKRAVQTTASKMQPPVQGQSMEELVASIDELIAQADSRLSGAEKKRKAAAGTALNQTHMDEVEGILDQVSEKTLKVKGTDHRDERDRLQTTNANLLSRWEQLQGGGANNGQSTVATTQPVTAVTGNQNQTEVDKISTALDTAEALVEVLRSNPDFSMKDNHCTKARSSLEKATQMLGELTDKDSKLERAELNTRLGNLNTQLNDIERGGNQGSTTQGGYVSSEQHRAEAMKKVYDVFGQGVSDYDGRVGDATVRNVCAGLSTVFAECSKPSREPARHLTSSNVSGGHGVTHQRQTNLPQMMQSPGHTVIPANQRAGHASQSPVPATIVFPPSSGVSSAGRQANITNIPLTGLAFSLGMSRASLFANKYIKADLRVDLSANSGKKIEPVMISSEAHFSQLSGSLQNRMLRALGKEAQKIVTAQKPLPDSMQTSLQPRKTIAKKDGNDSLPVENERLQKIMLENISVVQLFLVADDSKDFKSASFKMTLGSELTDSYKQIFSKSSEGEDKYIPLAADLSLPQELEKDAEFFKSSWALNEKLTRTAEAPFSFAGGVGCHRQDIGLAQLEKLLRAAGATKTTASSFEGVAIPFIVEASRQSNKVIDQLKKLHPHAHGVSDGSGSLLVPRGTICEGTFFDSKVDADAGSDSDSDEAKFTDGTTDSGIIPMALNTETASAISKGIRPGQVCETKAGILCVRMLAGIDVKDQKSLLKRIHERLIDLGDLDKITVL